MKLWHRISRRLKNPAQDFDRELESHLALESEDQQTEGRSPEDARYAARRAFGNTTIVTEDVRAIWSFAPLEHFLRHLRYAARSLRHSPGFAALAILTVALGIGANTIIFSAVNALILRPLPFPHFEQLVSIYSTKIGAGADFGNDNLNGPSFPDLWDFNRANHTFQQMVGWDTWRKNVSFGNSGAPPEQMWVGLVPATYFEILGVQPLMGRLFVAQENHQGRNFVAAISRKLWRSRFASDPAILGRKIIINDEPYTIVAIMPDVIPDWLDPAHVGSVEVWTPFPFTDDMTSESARGDRGYVTLARMKPGVTLREAQADLAAIAARLASEHPVDQGLGVSLKRLSDIRVGELRPMLLLLIGAVCLILLIACVNLANLLLARNSARQRELAIRAALGAGRAGLIRELLAETLLLALIGGALGLAFAWFGVAALAKIHPQNFPQLDSLSIDWRVLSFTLLASLFTSLLFGLAPSINSTKVDLIDALKQGGRTGTSGPATHRLRNILVITEIAMSLMLLIGASLLIRSIMRLETQSLGIRADHLLTAHIYLPPVHYPGAPARTRFCDEFGSRVRALPGVLDATVTTLYPPNNGWIQMLNISGHPITRVQDIPSAQFGVADAHFLATLGIPLLRGRDFSTSDTANTQPVVLISQAFQKRYFPNEDPIGKQIHIGPPPFLNFAPGDNILDFADVTIIGVMGDFKNTGLARAPEPQIVVLYSQNPIVNYGFKQIVIRTATEPRVLAPEVARQLHSLDPDMPLAQIQTMDDMIEESTGGQRFTSVLLTSFAAAGLLLAVVGIYGVVSFLVAQRNSEMAVRMALGASGREILWLVLKQGLQMAAIGAGIGLCGAWASEKLTASLLFGVSPFDRISFAAATAFLIAVAALASAIPAARVLRIDPAVVLHQD